MWTCSFPLSVNLFPNQQHTKTWWRTRRNANSSWSSKVQLIQFLVSLNVFVGTWLKHFRVANPHLSQTYKQDFEQDLKKLLEKPMYNKPVVLAPPTPGVAAFLESFKANIFQSLFLFNLLCN
jgi:hypothetical protein